MEFQDNKIILDKELSVLDEFVLDFVNSLNIDYVLVSGYVSILFGRSRGSEDIDMVIEPLDKAATLTFFDALVVSGFECINESRETAFDCLSESVALRFAKKGSVIPNMEVKFAKSFASKAALNNSVEVLLNNNVLKISPIELQIVYKRLCLRSEKDLEDARHLEIVFENHISVEKINKYKELLNHHGC